MRQNGKKVISKALAAFLISGMLPGGAVNAAALSSDGTFESGYDGFFARGVASADNPGIHLSIDNSEAYAGNSSLKITRTDSNRDFATEGINFKKGKVYKVSAAIKTEASSATDITLTIYGSSVPGMNINGKKVEQYSKPADGWFRGSIGRTNGTDWQRVEEYFTIEGVDAWSGTVGLRVENDGAGQGASVSYWVDDFSVTEALLYDDIMKDSNDILYSSFEEGVDEWENGKDSRSSVTRDADEAYTGMASAKFDQVVSGNAALTSVNAYNLEVGASYKLSAYVKVPDISSNPTMRFELYGQNEDTVSLTDCAERPRVGNVDWHRGSAITVGSADWKKYEWSFKVSSEDTSVQTYPVKIGIWGTVSGKAIAYYVDDVRLEKLGADDILVSNFQQKVGQPANNMDWLPNNTAISSSTEQTYGTNTHSLKIVKGGGSYTSVYHNLKLKRGKQYVMKAKAYVPDCGATATEYMNFIVAGELTNNLQNTSVAAYASVPIEYDKWLDIEKSFYYTGQQTDCYLNAVNTLGGGTEYFLCDLEFYEGNNNDISINNGISAWLGYGRNLSENSQVVCGNNTKSMYVSDGSASYTMAYIYVLPKDKTKYKAKAKVYVPDTGKALDGTEVVYYAIAKETTNNEANMLAFGKKPVTAYNQWLDLEFDYTHNSATEGTDNLVVLVLPIEGSVTSKAYYIGEASFEPTAKTSGLTDVVLDEKYNPTYTIDADAEYILGYRYYADSDIIMSGYVQKDEYLPKVDADAYSGKKIVLELCPVLDDGTVERGVKSSEVNPPTPDANLVIKKLEICDFASGEPVANISDAKKNGIYAHMDYACDIDAEALLIVAYYNSENGLISVESAKQTFLRSGDEVEYPTYESGLSLKVPQDAKSAKLFLWNDNFVPLIQNAFVE